MRPVTGNARQHNNQEPLEAGIKEPLAVGISKEFRGKQPEIGDSQLSNRERVGGRQTRLETGAQQLNSPVAGAHHLLLNLQIPGIQVVIKQFLVSPLNLPGGLLPLSPLNPPGGLLPLSRPRLTPGETRVLRYHGINLLNLLKIHGASPLNPPGGLLPLSLHHNRDNKHRLPMGTITLAPHGEDKPLEVHNQAIHGPRKQLNNLPLTPGEARRLQLLSVAHRLAPHPGSKATLGKQLLV
jgi:hypothetical protein